MASASKRAKEIRSRLAALSAQGGGNAMPENRCRFVVMRGLRAELATIPAPAPKPAQDPK